MFRQECSSIDCFMYNIHRICICIHCHLIHSTPFHHIIMMAKASSMHATETQITEYYVDLIEHRLSTTTYVILNILHDYVRHCIHAHCTTRSPRLVGEFMRRCYVMFRSQVREPVSVACTYRG